MKCLFCGNVNEFYDYLADIDMPISWYIKADNPKKRIEYIKATECYTNLKRLGVKNGLTISDIEILSWIDTLSIMASVFSEDDENGVNNEIKIIQEYCIPLNNKRIDYLLLYKNKVLIIEFSFERLNDDYTKYEKKLNQVIGYKELLSTLLPSHIEFGTFTFLINAEVKYGYKIEHKNKYTGEQDSANGEKISELVEVINTFFTNTKENAFEELISMEKRLNNRVKVIT